MNFCKDCQFLKKEEMGDGCGSVYVEYYCRHSSFEKTNYVTGNKYFIEKLAREINIDGKCELYRRK